MKFFSLGMIMAFIGCSQTSFNYYYVSLERAVGIEVVNCAKIELRNLEKNSEIPTEYALSRESYSLNFLIGNKSYYPHFKIAVSGVDDNLFLKPRRDIDIVSDEGNICASYYLNNNDRSMMDFGWAVNCIAEDIKKTISFDVVDSSGAVIGKEDIPFTIECDGKYTLLDAI